MQGCLYLTLQDCYAPVENAVLLLLAGPDIEKGWYGIPAARGDPSLTDVQMAQRPTLASRMARLRGFADTGYASLQVQLICKTVWCINT